MIFDSIRQSKNYIKNSYGIGRYNVRINFYIYEIHRLGFLRTKTVAFLNPKSSSKSLNIEVYELTNVSYSFIK